MLKSKGLGSNHKESSIHMKIGNESTITKHIHNKFMILGKESEHKL